MHSETNQFSLNEDQKAVLDTANQFAKKELYPFAEKMDNEEWWPDGIFKKMGDAGLIGLTVDPKYGGAGMSYLQAGLVCQAFGRWNHAVALSWVAHDNLCLDNIYRNGSDYVREKFVPGLCSGDLVGALGLTEPGAGSDALGSMRTTAKKEGDYYILNGSKTYITNGSIADVILVHTKTDINNRKKGISSFVIETKNPGFKIISKLKKMGYRGSQTSELFFENFKVPAKNMIGQEGQGHITVMNGLDFERAMIAPIALGISERALEISIEYAKIREQFGKPISNFQMVQSKLADMYTSIQSMKALVYSVLAECDSCEKKQAGKGKIHMNTSASIMFASTTTNKILDDAVQIHGGMGYMWESEINRLYRSSKMLDIGAGTTEIRKKIISKGLLE
tara:strand:- start:2303 stop:3481 length:1179 start_codon:yes stop_codon:yes gene_type:complete